MERLGQVQAIEIFDESGFHLMRCCSYRNQCHKYKNKVCKSLEKRVLVHLLPKSRQNSNCHCLLLLFLGSRNSN